MPFKQGHDLGKGRPKGAINRSTEQAKLTLARLANKGLDNITQDIDKIRKENPVKAAEIYLKLLEYVVPKLRAVDMKVDAEVNAKVEGIKIHIISGSKKDGDTIKDN
jgi:hypothetical protein